jgi:hypothetical protein
MGFAGALVAIPAGANGEGPQQFDMALFGLTLALFVADPAAIVNADTGELVTAAPVANQTQLPTTFGFGPGRWRNGDQNLIDVALADNADTTQGAAGQLPAPHVALVAGAYVTFVPGLVAPFGDLSIRIHNRGLTACAALRINVRYKPSLTR